MATSNPYAEEISSQIPALQLLINLGWRYLTPAEALHLRGGREKNVVLTGVLQPWLRQHNEIRTKGASYAFDDARINEAVSKLVDEPVQSLTLTNETLYELLTLGTSLTQTIDGDRKSYSFHYIDWQHPERNVYHVSDEFSVEKRGSHETRRPDMVLFVNGIPLVVIECKRPDLDQHGEKAVAEAVEPDAAQPERRGDSASVRHIAAAAGAQPQRRALRHHRPRPRNSGPPGEKKAHTKTPSRRLINRPLDARYTGKRSTTGATTTPAASVVTSPGWVNGCPPPRTG